jgi:hypothetical protein
VPYVIRIEQPRDLLRFERDLRVLLQCEGQNCAFLHSADYADIKFRARHALLSGEPGTARMLHLPNSSLLLHVSDDCLTLVVQADPVLVLYPTASDEQQQPHRQRGRALCGDEPLVPGAKANKRKALLATAADTNNNAKKRGRGRPRKVRTVDTDDAAAPNESATDDTEFVPPRTCTQSMMMMEEEDDSALQSLAAAAAVEMTPEEEAELARTFLAARSALKRASTPAQ